MSVMSGEKLHKDTFIAASTEQRKTMFTDMIDIMAQM